MISLKSEITKKLLNYFFINPEESLYVNELVRKLSLDKRNLAKKIRELEREGMLKSQVKGNLKLFSINTAYPLYKEYRQILLKTIGFEERLTQALKAVPGIKKAYIYGSYAQGKMEGYSDIDVLAVGSHAILNLQKRISALQKEIDREINVVNMDTRDFEKRIGNNDPFVKGVLKNKHIRIF